MSQIRSASVAAGIIMVLAGCTTTATNSVRSRAEGDVGRIHFESTNPYDFKQILDGGRDASSIQVFGDLVIPEGAKGRVPAIVFVHGSNGWSAKHELYLDELHRMGIATFRMDSFTPRGVTSTIGEQVSVTETMMISDAFHALRLLSTHPRIDPERIGIMGGSKGGAVALFTAWEPIRRAALGPDLKFALHLPLYPPCAMLQRLQFTGAPIQILSGELDEWTPAAPCVELVHALRAAGYPADITVYPDAWHSFDSLEPPRFVDSAFNITKCRFEVKTDGTTVETNSGIPLDTLQNRQKAISRCASRGVMSGRNEAAAQKTMEAVRAFVTGVFDRSVMVAGAP